MDRTEVILDIFATRARSAERRCRWSWRSSSICCRASPACGPPVTHPSGIGCGSRETQLETDRRAIRRKISVLKKRSRRGGPSRQPAQGRRPCPGGPGRYTNAGKSSVLRALSGDDIFVKTAVRDARHADPRGGVAGGTGFVSADTVGFIRKLPHHLVASFRATLEEARAADCCSTSIDARIRLEEQVNVVERELRMRDFGLRY